MTDETRTYIHILTQAICSNHAATSPVTDIDSLIHRLGGRIEEMRPLMTCTTELPQNAETINSVFALPRACQPKSGTSSFPENWAM